MYIFSAVVNSGCLTDGLESTYRIGFSCPNNRGHLRPPPASEAPMPPDTSRRIPYSKVIIDGKLDVVDVVQPIYDEINKEYGLNEKPDK